MEQAQRLLSPLHLSQRLSFLNDKSWRRQLPPAIPLVAPPQDSTVNNVQFGSLNSKDPAFYFNSTTTTLFAIVQSAPADIRQTIPSTASKDILLNEVFRLRQEEAFRTALPMLPHKESLTKLMKMTPPQIMSLARTDPDKLRSLMHSALVADSTLTPRNFSLCDNNDLAATAITWQLQSYQQAHNFTAQGAAPAPDDQPPQIQPPGRRVRFSENIPQASIVTPATGTVQSLTDLLGPDSTAAPSSVQHLPQGEDSSDDSDGAERQSKKQKSDIQPDFGYGATSAVKKLIRSPYPGKGYSPNIVNVKKRLGPRILCSWIAHGIDVPTFLHHFKWQRNAANLPTQADIEAHTLGRAIHLEMLTCQTPEHALQTKPCLEVLLRRLHAIMYVEQSMSNETYTYRALALKNIEFFLETHPNASVLCDDITEEIQRRIALKKKHITEVRSMEQARAASRKQININKNRSPRHTPPKMSPKKAGYQR